MNNINSEVFRYNQKLQGPATAGTGGCDKKSETIRLLSKNNLANSLMGFRYFFGTSVTFVSHGLNRVGYALKTMLFFLRNYNLSKYFRSHTISLNASRDWIYPGQN